MDLFPLSPPPADCRAKQSMAHRAKRFKNKDYQFKSNSKILQIVLWVVRNESKFKLAQRLCVY